MLQRPPNDLNLHWIKTGVAQQVPTIPWISSDFSDLGTTLAAGGYGLGPSPSLNQPWFDQWGNTFSMAIQRGGGLTIGQIVEWNGPGTDTVSSSTNQVITLTTGALTAGAEVNNFVWDAVLGASKVTDCLKRIKDNAAATLTVSLTDPIYGNFTPDPDAYATANIPAAAEALSIIRPFETKIFPTADAAFGIPQGVAIGTVTQNHFYLRQTGGLALCLSVVSPAYVPNKPIIPSAATAGSVISNATLVGNEVGFGAVTYNVATTALVPTWLTSRP